MKVMKNITQQEDVLNVLVVGNNPIDLSHTFESLMKIREHKIMTEIAFDLTSILERLVYFRPNFIVIDDNIGRMELQLTVQALLKNRKTKDIPITVLKNSNYEEALNTGVMNYVLKKALTGESLYTALKNSVKFKKTQLYLQQAYAKRKGQMLRILMP